VAGDTNAQEDIFLKELDTGTIKRINVAADGTEGNAGSHDATITANGLYVVFHTDATNLDGSTTIAGQVYVYDVANDSLEKISVDSAGVEGNAYSNGVAISEDGRYVTFFSQATNLVAGDTNATDDVFLHDRTLNTTTRISTDATNTEVTGMSTGTVGISGDGTYVVFSSDSTGLVAGDTNAVNDVFIKNTSDNSVSRISERTGGTEATGGGSHNPDITSDGRYVVFDSAATNLDSAITDTNAQNDILGTTPKQEQPFGSTPLLAEQKPQGADHFLRRFLMMEISLLLPQTRPILFPVFQEIRFT